MSRPSTSARPPSRSLRRVSELTRRVATAWVVACRLSFACLLGTVGFVGGPFFTGANVLAVDPNLADEPVPSWMLGVPTWDGKRYLAPPATPSVPSGGGSNAGSSGAGGSGAGTTTPLRSTPSLRSTSGPTRNPVYHVPVDSSGNPTGSPRTVDPAAWGDPVGATGSSSLRLNSPAGTPPPDSRSPDSRSPDSSPPDSSPPRSPRPGPLPAPQAEMADEDPVADGVPAGDANPDAEAILPGDAELEDESVGSLGERLEAGVIEEPPLEEDVTRWYNYPLRWLSKGWKNHAEFGLNGAEGNARTLAIQTGLELKRKTKLDTFAIDFDYRQARNRTTTTEDNGRLNVDYDRMVGESSWSMFNKFGLEWDEFKAFDLRVNLNGGVGYHWLRDEQTTFVTRFGAGASRPFGSPIDRWTQEAVFGIDLEHQLTERQKLKGKVDYFPAWSDFSQFRLVSDVSWEVLLDGSDNLSLKVGVTDRYDSNPQGARPNDVYYSMLLLYKF